MELESTFFSPLLSVGGGETGNENDEEERKKKREEIEAAASGLGHTGRNCPLHCLVALSIFWGTQEGPAELGHLSLSLSLPGKSAKFVSLFCQRN